MKISNSMKKLEETVELSESCYYTMLRSVIEPLEPGKPKESVGDLLGKKLRENFVCKNAYPWITAKRKPRSVMYYDNAAKRIRRLNQVINTLGGLGTYVIGGYHSHYFTNDEILNHGLSDWDINHRIIPEMGEQNKDYWIELILNIRERKYKKSKPTGEFVIQYSRKLRVILRDAEKHCYDITFSAYKVTNLKKPRIKELNLRRRKVKVVKVKN